MTSNRFFPGNNQWRKQQPPELEIAGRCFTGLQGFGKRGRSTEPGLKYSQQRKGPGTDRNQQVRSGENGKVLLRRTKSKENLMFDRENRR
jgi:hypothetical protein